MSILVLVICIVAPIVFGTCVYFAIKGDKPRKKMYSASKGDKPLNKAMPLNNLSSLETKSQEQSQSQKHTSHPQTQPHQSQLARFHFVVGEKYVSKKDYRDEDSVLECVAMRGKNKRMVAFFDYGRLEIGRDERSDIERADWFSLKMDGDVEVCNRGKIRADNIASPQQVQMYAQQARDDQTAWRTYWANRKAEKERVAKLERIAKEHGIDV